MIVLRKAVPIDIPIISDLAEQIWPRTYSSYISEEQLRYMLDKMYNREVLSGQLADGHTFLIASEQGNSLGFAGFSEIDKATKTYKLHKLYVLPDTHRKGLGSLLIKEVIRLASEDGGKFLQLNVNRNNSAKDFYLKKGFKIKETVDIEIGNGFFMNDYVMELAI